MKKKTLVFVIVALLLAIALIVGGISAYFTDTDTKTNTFTIGNVNITLTEPNWSTADSNSNNVPDAAENLVPGQSVVKDPTVTVETGSNDAYIFVKVEIPNYPNASSANTDLFSVYHNVSGTPTAGVKDQWNLVTDSVSNNVHTYVYSYVKSTASANSTAASDLQAVSATTAVTLFDGVTLSTDNTVVGAASTATGNENVIVTAYAIQADNVTETTQSAIWNLFNS